MHVCRDRVDVCVRFNVEWNERKHEIKIKITHSNENNNFLLISFRFIFSGSAFRWFSLAPFSCCILRFVSRFSSPMLRIHYDLISVCFHENGFFFFCRFSFILWFFVVASLKFVSFHTERVLRLCFTIDCTHSWTCLFAFRSLVYLPHNS